MRNEADQDSMHYYVRIRNPQRLHLHNKIVAWWPHVCVSAEPSTVQCHSACNISRVPACTFTVSIMWLGLKRGAVSLLGFVGDQYTSPIFSNGNTSKSQQAFTRSPVHCNYKQMQIAPATSIELLPINVGAEVNSFVINGKRKLSLHQLSRIH